MRAATVAGLLLLAAPLLAGCVEDDPATITQSEEVLEIFLNSVETPYAVGLPLWIAPDGPTAEEWLQAFQTAQPGAPANLSLRETERGTALWIEAQRDLELSNLGLRITYPEPRGEPHFADGAYTLGSDAQGRPHFVIAEGLVEVTGWLYEGASGGADPSDRNCYLSYQHQKVEPTVGWNTMQTGGAGYECL